jgi:hypothetical protein
VEVGKRRYLRREWELIEIVEPKTALNRVVPVVNKYGSNKAV